MAYNKQYTPFIIIGSMAAVIFTIGFIFRKKISETVDAVKEASDSGVGITTYLFTNNITFHLDQLNQKWRPLFEKLIKYMQDNGYTVQINSSYRTFARQAQLKLEDSRNAAAGLSMHNYGGALDIQLSKNGKIYGKDTPNSEWLATGIPQYAESIGLQWGGTAFGSGYHDDVHFQVAGYTGSQLQQLAYKQFGTTDPNQIQGNKLNLA